METFIESHGVRLRVGSQVRILKKEIWLPENSKITFPLEGIVTEISPYEDDGYGGSGYLGWYDPATYTVEGIMFYFENDVYSKNLEVVEY